MGRANRRFDAAAVVALVLLAAAVFGQTATFGFISLDDPIYVSKNQHVAQGLTPAAVGWALTATHTSMWQPLTWLSHMLDVSAYGLSPGGHHITNLALHAANAALWYLALLALTGARWPAAAVAALFVVHPLRVEPVAWVSERRELLATFLALLTLLAYARAVRRGGVLRSAAVPLLFALALMTKPMAVTLPLLLLLLDWWPLGRWAPGPAGRLPPRHLLLEKLPLFLLAAASVAATLLVTRAGGVVASLEALPLAKRLANAAISTAAYLGATFWPANLAVFYPHAPAFPPVATVASAVAAIVAASLIAARQARRRPWVAVGWLWYLVALVPVLGLVQVGSHAMADRYTYLPGVGVLLALAWTAAGLGRGLRASHLAAPAALVVLCLGAVAWRQTHLWGDEAALFRHATRVVAGNAAAHSQLGAILAARGDDAGAEEQFLLSLQADDSFSGSHANYAFLLHRQGRLAAAREHAARAMAISPGPGARFKLPELLAAIDREEAVAARRATERHFREGVRLAGEGRNAEAVAEFESVLAADPGHAAALNNLGALYASVGNGEQAVAHLRRAVEARPEYTEARFNLGRALVDLGRPAEGEAALREALRLRPDSADIAANLGVALERQGRRADASASYRRALEIDRGNPVAAAGLARLGESRPDP